MIFCRKEGIIMKITKALVSYLLAAVSGAFLLTGVAILAGR